MTRHDKPRPAKPHTAKARFSRLMLACAVAFAVLLLLLRMLVFVHGHGRR